MNMSFTSDRENRLRELFNVMAVMCVNRVDCDRCSYGTCQAIDKSRLKPYSKERTKELRVLPL